MTDAVFSRAVHVFWESRTHQKLALNSGVTVQPCVQERKNRTWRFAAWAGLDIFRASRAINKLPRAFAIALFLGLVAPHAASACQSYEVRLIQIGATSYLPTDAAPTLARMRIETVAPDLEAACANLPVVITNQINDVRRFGAGVNRLVGTPPNSGSSTATINSSITLSPAARSQLVTTGSLDLDFLEFQSGQFLNPGLFLSDMAATVGTADAGSNLFTMTVEPAVRLVGQSQGGTGTIKFARLATGEVATTLLFYQTNATLRLTADATNLAHIVHERGVGFGQYPYSLRVNGRSLAMNTGAALTISPTSNAAEAATVQLTLGQVEANPVAGRYSGLLTLTLTAF